MNHALSSHLYPRLPGIQRPYGRILGRQLVLSQAEVEIGGLAEPFHGLRILLITDIHAGPFLARDALHDAFRRLGQVEPDLILLGGDLTSSRVAEFLDQREAFASLRAPLGVRAVMGNHDHYTGEIDRLVEQVEAAGIGVLHNRSEPLRRRGSRLWLAGVDDLLVGRPDLDRALAGTDGPVILLSHNPDLFFEAARRGVALTLSGHTHAGQVRLPGLPVLVRQSRYRLDEGRYRLGGSQLIVSRGLGVVGIPWRAWCPPEAVLITLRAR